MGDDNGKRLVATVHGRVQGVYFRETTRRLAQTLGLTGWVANLAEGTVKVVAEGSGEALDELAAFLHTGPPAASVSHVNLNRVPATKEFGDFRVRWL